jgi:hypothetical protein
VKLLEPPGANAIVIAVAVGAFVAGGVALSRHLRTERRPVPVER